MSKVSENSQLYDSIIKIFDESFQDIKNKLDLLLNNKNTEKSLKKDKNAPKNPISPYMFFCKEMIKTLKEENPDKSVKEILQKDVSQLWKNITEKEKKKYNKLAEDDKKRYHQEMEVYKNTQNTQNTQNNQPQKEKKKTLINSYIVFCSEFREKLKEENPDSSSQVIAKELGNMWNNLSKEEKLVYKEKADDINNEKNQ
jgi:hypothetical protein